MLFVTKLSSSPGVDVFFSVYVDKCITDTSYQDLQILGISNNI